MIDGNMYEDKPDIFMSRILKALVSALFMMMMVNFCTLSILTTYTIIVFVVEFSTANKPLSLLSGELRPDL